MTYFNPKEIKYESDNDLFIQNNLPIKLSIWLYKIICNRDDVKWSCGVQEHLVVKRKRENKRGV